MNNINDIYKSHSDRLKAEDLGHQMYTMTIKLADLVEFDATDRKIVLSFVEDARTLPLNKTNATSIGELYGPDWALWAGKQITLFAMPVDFGGKTVQGIRVRAPQNFQQQAAQPVGQAPGQAPQQAIPQGQQQYDERNPPPVGENTYADNFRAG